MKILKLPTIALLLIVLAFGACDDMTVTTGDGSHEVNASGKVVWEERVTGAFDQIITEGVFDIYLIQKDKEAVRIQADESVLPYILTEVKGNVLTVKLKEDSKLIKMKKINVYITLKDVKKIQTKGVGLMHCMDTLELKHVVLDLEGVGETKLKLNCDSLNVRSELIGALFLQGSATKLTIRYKGIGSFNAFNFKAEIVDLESDGIGKTEVFASKEIRIDANGLGGVVYKGNPSKKNIRHRGLGTVSVAQ